MEKSLLHHFLNGSMLFRSLVVVTSGLFICDAMKLPKKKGWYFTIGFYGLYDYPLYFDGYRWFDRYFGRSDLLKPVTMNGSWRKKKQVVQH